MCRDSPKDGERGDGAGFIRVIGFWDYIGP